MTGTYHLVTLGCPKNQVDSDKLAGTLAADGMQAVNGAGEADLIVVNTCAFVDEARRESIDTVLALADKRRDGARLVVTGCMAERYGDELAEALPEVDRVAGFGVPVTLGPKPSSGIQPETAPLFDLLNLPRPASDRPWAYVKVAEGCDRACGFCAIPTFRGPQRSRSMDDVLAEVDALDAREIILVAQDLAAFGRDQGVGDKAIVPLVEAVAARVDRVRLLYLYPSELTDRLVDAVCVTGVPYFDLSLQHVSSPLMRRMRRWGDGGRFLERIEAIRAREPEAAFRSNFIVGYPGETEAEFDYMLDWLDEAQLDRVGCFKYENVAGARSNDLPDHVPEEVKQERWERFMQKAQAISEAKLEAKVGQHLQVIVDEVDEEAATCRTMADAPEIDGNLFIDEGHEILKPGDMLTVKVDEAGEYDLWGRMIGS